MLQYVNDTLLPGFCANTYGYTDDLADISCFDSYNPDNPIFTDSTLSNTNYRQWQW